MLEKAPNNVITTAGCRLPSSNRATAIRASATSRSPQSMIRSFQDCWDSPHYVSNRAILDFNTLKLYFQGPGDRDIEQHLPAGTDAFQLEVAPSGHLVLPCCEYQPGSTSQENTLTLLARKTNRGGQQEPEAATTETSSSSERRVPEAAAGIPPPPAAPPRLPMTVRFAAAAAANPPPPPEL